jgi:hypothetical protein
MEFTITCPVDGPVTVSLEDIDTVVLKDSERADITFVCPHCGSEITVSAIVPSFLLAAIEALAEDTDATGSLGGVIEVIHAETGAEVEPRSVEVETDEVVTDAYCEYFRRQLSHVENVEDALSEIDSGVS